MTHQRRSERRTDPTPTRSTPGRSSAASGVMVAEKRTVLPHGCNCGARWAGSNTAHCGACHVTLSSVTAFDRHRRGGECHDPTEVGLVRIDRAGYHVWGWPSRDDGGQPAWDGGDQW